MMQSNKNYRVCLIPSDVCNGFLKSFKVNNCDTLLSGELFRDENGQNVYEVVQFREDLRSWFCGNLVIKDGSLLMITRIDPIYLLLPYLIKLKSMFRSLPDLLSMDDGFKEIINAIQEDDLALICDTKQVDDTTYYRLNEKETLKWLKVKINHIVNCLKKLSIDVSPSIARVSNFVSGRSAPASHTDHLKYAFNLISDYLPQEMTELLRKALDIKIEAKKSENQSTVAQQGLKRSCTETGPINDYFTPKTPMDSVKKAKLSRSQNELATESKKNGIVSVANFFKPKK